ncbi:hypothetical protein HRbin36_00589 [bacterium HR36]|nr:hypothetical protein HRbin36_00589 [bacterium HR36]
MHHPVALSLISLGFMAAVIFTLLGPMNAGQEDKTQSIVKQVQGRWRPIRVWALDFDGKIVEAPLEDSEITVTFLGKLGLVHRTTEKGREVAPFAYLLDTNAQPVGCDQVSYDGFGKTGRVKIPAIMKLENDRLYIAHGQIEGKTRPKSFKVGKEHGCYVILIFERVDKRE